LLCVHTRLWKLSARCISLSFPLWFASHPKPNSEYTLYLGKGNNKGSSYQKLYEEDLLFFN
jgi:hypothetical protein